MMLIRRYIAIVIKTVVIGKVSLVRDMDNFIAVSKFHDQAASELTALSRW